MLKWHLYKTRTHIWEWNVKLCTCWGGHWRSFRVLCCICGIIVCVSVFSLVCGVKLSVCCGSAQSFLFLLLGVKVVLVGCIRAGSRDPAGRASFVGCQLTDRSLFFWRPPMWHDGSVASVRPVMLMCPRLPVVFLIAVYLFALESIQLIMNRERG